MKGLGREFKVAAMGEIMLTRPVSVYEEPDFLSVVKLFRDADVAITNIEGFGFTGFVGARVVGTGGTPMLGETWLAEEFKWMGFNLVSIANNHVVDFGSEGLLASMNVLKDIRLSHAGAGKDLWDARQPGYVETKAGRASMIATTSAGVQVVPSTGIHTVATESGNGLPGRPGVNGLRHDIIYTVKPEHFEELKRINETWGQSSNPAMTSLRPKIDKEEIVFLGNRFVVGDKPGVQHIILKQDLEGNLRSIQNAARNSSLVIAANHCHENDPSLHDEWGNASAEFIRQYAKDCIDTGAHIFYGHGDHAGQGMEIYNGRPIFYSLGNPIVTSQNVKRMALEEYERFGLERDAGIADWMVHRWEQSGGHYAEDNWMKAIVPVFTMVDGQLTELTLYPIDGTAGEPAGTFVNRGSHVVMAKGEEAEQIIERYRELSKPFGTEIKFKDGVGIVEV
ncbi:MAG: poly-gamma-glutamate synthesis protein (capsule biosynthesis protein) [Chloroflexi bacterium]|jgi:poly-gamma-glutamate synthesis protein (capsule biosynthesis protein)|nr:MAG: poly-gamma-glutamate synthesis protein (capsule biosynthesis protein) [Chloroflexota bacterium]